MNMCKKCKLLTCSVLLLFFVAASYNVIETNRIHANAAAWFQEINQVHSLISENRMLPSRSSDKPLGFTADTVYRDTFTPTGPPPTPYSVGGEKNFGLAHE